MRYSFFITFLIFMSCSSSRQEKSNQLWDQVDYVEMEIGGNTYYALTSELDFINRCIATECTDLCTTCDSKLQNGSATPRKAIQRSIPTKELSNLNGSYEMNFWLVINKDGDVVMTSIKSCSKKINEEIQKNIALHYFQYKFEKDENSPCLSCTNIALRLDLNL